MTPLSSKQILQEKNTTDADSITSLTLTHKALSDQVSCLSEFKNLEKLDLGFNNLTSLEGLKLCTNLKWLSVVQNKLQSLKGIEGLTKLTVLNAGKNKLKSMNEVKSLVSLRALILNDNDISSVCKLDQMKELNTLVLSRNPISSVGDSLIKLKSITKLSLSNCLLQTIDLSLKSCTELKELRLSHNEIMTLPSEFSRFLKLQNLDLGNNLISNWSNLKVLSSLINLKNLNLQGNLVAEQENLVKKVKKLLPNLHILNAKPIDKLLRNKGTDSSVETDYKLPLQEDTKIDHGQRNKNSIKAHPVNESMDNDKKNAVGTKNKKKRQIDEKTANGVDATISEKGMKKKLKSQQNESSINNDGETLKLGPDEVKKSKHQKQKTSELMETKASDSKVESALKEKKSRKKIKVDNLNMIDDSETPFTDLFAISAVPEISTETGDHKFDHRTGKNKVDNGVVSITIMKGKKNLVAYNAELELSQVDQIGLGGPSAWV